MKIIDKKTIEKLSYIFWKMDPNCPDEPEVDKDGNIVSEYAKGIKDFIELLLETGC